MDFTKILTISVIVIVVIVALKVLKMSGKVVNFVIWLVVVSILIYLLLPVLDPLMQKVAVAIPNSGTCYGLILESEDCFGFVNPVK